MPDGRNSEDGNGAILPEPKTEPEKAVVWIGYRVGNSESRHATGFAISPTTVVTDGWHDAWLEGAAKDSVFTLLAGIGDRSTPIRGFERVPVGDDVAGLLRITIDPLDGLEPVDPATIGEPPTPGTPVQWITWTEWTGDAIPFRKDAFLREAVTPGVLWKFEPKDRDQPFASRFAGSPIVIDKRVFGILSLNYNGEMYVLSPLPIVDR